MIILQHNFPLENFRELPPELSASGINKFLNEHISSQFQNIFSKSPELGEHVFIDFLSYFILI